MFATPDIRSQARTPRTSSFIDKDMRLSVMTALNPEGQEEVITTATLRINYDFHDVCTSIHSTGLRAYILNPVYLVLCMPLAILMPSFLFFDLKGLRRLCYIHLVPFRDKTKHQLYTTLSDHLCTRLCGSTHIVVFKGRPFPRTQLQNLASLNPVSEAVPSLSHVQETGEVQSDQHSNTCAVEMSVDTESSGEQSSGFYTDHLDVSTEDEKFEIVAQWENSMSNEALALGVCASCGGMRWMSSMKWVKGEALHLELLTNPDLEPALLPTSYARDVYSGAILDVRGLQSPRELGKLLLCRSCENTLKKGMMPKFALANHLYFAREQLPEPVRLAFEQSSLFERRLICRARYNNISCRYSGTGYNAGTEEGSAATNGHSIASDLSRARKGVKGNVMVVPTDTVRLNKVIPPPSSVIKDTMCVVFVGTEKPTLESIRPQHKSPVLVRRSRVKMMISFLMKYNRCYTPSDEFAYSPANLDLLLPPGEDEGIMPFVEVGHIERTDALEASSADYTPRGEEVPIPDGEDELVFENVGYTDGDVGPSNYHAMKYIAMERCRRGMPFILSGTGNVLIPDFNNPNLLTWLFPHLDPWGIAGFLHPKRRIRISIEQQLRHMLTSADRLFERDEQFAFVFYNIIRKLQVASSIRFSVSPAIHRQLTTSILSINPETLADMATKYKDNPWYVPSTDEERRVHKVMSSVTLVSHQIPGSNGHKLVLRNQIRALINDQGPPTLFLTLNPADVDNPVVRLLAGEEVDLECVSGDETLDSWRRRLFAAKHPAACAIFFDTVISRFISIGLQYDSHKRRRGIFGICTAYFGTVEAQGKGTLHCHMLIWLHGHLPPHELRKAMLGSAEYRDKVFNWVESIIKCEFPQLSNARDIPNHPAVQPSQRMRYFTMGNPHPGTIPSPSVKIAYDQSASAFWDEFNQFVVQLLHEYHWHVHNMSCWKYLRKGERRGDDNCRLRMDGVTRDKTTIHPETGELFLRRLHPRIAAYNDLVTFMLKSNSELKYVGSGKAARDLVYYITDYVTKPSLPVHAGMAALQYALQKIGRIVDLNVGGRSQSVDASALIATVNSMMGRHEISHPQVMSYLIGGGDHYTSHSFSVLSFGAFLTYVDRSLASQHTGDQELSSTGSTERAHGNSGTINYTLDVGKDAVTTSNQQMDYVHRSTEELFDQLCLYDFVALVRKEGIPKAMLKDGNLDAVKGSFASWDHQQRASHRLVSRSRPHVPVLLGPSIPNPNRSEEIKEIWAKYIVILFVPWRDPRVLKGGHQTWLQVYESYERMLTSRHRQIIDNMNAFAESSDERASEPRKRTRDPGYDDNMSGYLCHASAVTDAVDESNDQVPQRYGSDLPNPFLSFNHRGLSDKSLDQYISIRIGPEIVPLLDCCHQVTEFIDTLQPVQSVHVRELTVADLPKVAEHQSFMKDARQKRIDHLEEPELSSPETNGPRRRFGFIQGVIQPRVAVTTLSENQDQFTHQPHIQPEQVVCQVIQEMNLASNPEQLKAFTIVSNHLIHDDPKQLLMYVSGVGGTGKSHVIKSIVRLFKALGCESELLLGAPTGIAAVLIGGQTLHSLAFINTNGRGGRNPALISTWRNIRYLIIDEVSMIGAQLLSLFSNRIREAKMGYQDDVSLPFGGVNVIFMGDFGQLKPPVQHSLYAHAITNNPSFRNASSVDGISSSNGIVLWRQVGIVVELLQNQRQSADPEYSAFLMRLRLGLCRPPSPTYQWDDLAYLRSRLLVNLSKDELMKFRDAPIIVGSKVTRDALNAKLIAYNAHRLGEQVHLYHSVDSVSKAAVPSGLRNMLWNIDSTKTQEALGRLPLFVGMKVMVTENIAFGSGIVNGSEGIVHSVYYNEDGFGTRTVVSVYVKIQGCGLHLPDMDEDVVPIFPVNTSIKYSFCLNGDIPCKSFSRKQVPLVPAYAYTDFKSQGRTLTVAFVDLATARGQGVYVMLSRVKSLQGVVILRWFHPAKIFSRLSPELRDEMTRLAALVTACEGILATTSSE